MNNANIRKRCSRQSCSSSSSFPAPLTRLYQEALPTCSFQENRLDYKRIQLSFTKRWNLCIGWEHFTTADWISFWNSTLRHRPEHQTSLHDLFITFIAPSEPVVHFRVFSGHTNCLWAILIQNDLLVFPLYLGSLIHGVASQPKPTQRRS